MLGRFFVWWGSSVKQKNKSSNRPSNTELEQRLIISKKVVPFCIENLLSIPVKSAPASNFEQSQNV